MIFVGIDIASEKHDCCFLNEKNKIIHSLSLYNKVRFREMHNYDRMVGLLWIGAAPYGGVC